MRVGVGFLCSLTVCGGSATCGVPPLGICGQRSDAVSYTHLVAKQLWYDFGLGKGGDIFTLAGEFLQSDDFMKQAKFIAEAANMTVAGWEKPVYLSKPTESVFEDVEVAPLLRSLLTEYLEERGIPYAIASRHCCRLNYGVRGKRYFAVGFPNMAGGYEVRSRYFKGCIPPKSVSLVKANDIPADECLVFEGFMAVSYTHPTTRTRTSP